MPIIEDNVHYFHIPHYKSNVHHFTRPVKYEATGEEKELVEKWLAEEL